MKKKVQLQFFALAILLGLAGNIYAQSMSVPTITVAPGNSAELALIFSAGGNATNFDFTMHYDPTVVDEASISVICDPVATGLTSLTCVVDEVNNEIKGIGINLPATDLVSGGFADISLPTLANAATGFSVNPIAEHFATITTIFLVDTTWTLNVEIVTCNVNTVAGVTENFNATHEACEILVLGPDFIAADGSSVSVSSGWEIDFLPGFTVEQGGTLDANVCGQSLCMISTFPMPYGCHSCVDQICDIDPTCCDTGFDQACLDKVNTVCGLLCE